jgi:hypothetical protein
VKVVKHLVYITFIKYINPGFFAEFSLKITYGVSVKVSYYTFIT